MLHHSRYAIPLLVLMACPLWTAHAQSTKAELFGIVRDPGSLPVNGATVDLVNTGTDAKLSVASDANGNYHFFALPAGTYSIAVAKEGFAKLRRDGIVLRVGDQISIDLELRVGDITQSIEVTAAAPLLQSTRGTTSFVVEQKKIVSLPLDGRNFVPLIALSPGVNLPPGNLLPRINGSRPRVSEYIYDGISVLQPEPGQVAFYPIVDAIEEFRVETNSPSAEYGRSNGGVIMVNQKSGSNSLHGTLFEFFRNETLNARNLFATTGAKPRFRRNQYGFILGGPVQKNKTFFFVDWQGTRLDTGVVRTSTVPTSAQKRGVLPNPSLTREALVNLHPATSGTHFLLTPSPRQRSIPRHAPLSIDIRRRMCFRERTKRTRTTTVASARTLQLKTSSTSGWIAISGPGTRCLRDIPFCAMIPHLPLRSRTAAVRLQRPTSARHLPVPTASSASIPGI
ncbi:MAG: carboxypeptidase regulatory-like domain-containing protein [Bryobacterales bacterium]|nr:carboxypeptidase regulatory-like domain-containing protein [Bryobacterales bacterium]